MVLYRFEASPTFWRNYRKLSKAQQQAAQRAWNIFKQNPFDSRLRTHKIHSLSARGRRTVYAVVIEADLRVIFTIRENTVYTLDIGSHILYRA